MTPNPQSDLVTNLRTLCRSLLLVRTGLKPLREQAATPGFGPSDLTADAFVGLNSDLDGGDVANLFVALNAIEATLTNPATGAPTDNAAALIKFAGKLPVPNVSW